MRYRTHTEVLDEQVELAGRRVVDPGHSDDYLDGVGEDLQIDDGSVDVVVYSYSLHHVPVDDMDRALLEAWRVLRAGGLLYVLEPVADGPGHEVAAIIDDETEVRRRAQAALDRAVQDGFVEIVRQAYDSQDVYRDFTDWESAMVGVDPDRAAQMLARRPEALAAFEANASRTADGRWSFVEPNLVRVLAKT